MISRIRSLGYVEYGLIISIIWGVLWLVDEYLASMLTAIFVPIFFFIMAVSFIDELIERSRVPKSFFVYISLAWAIPLAIALFVYFVFGGVFDWLQEL